MATYQLTVVLGAEAGKQFEVPDAGVTLGRSRMAGIQLADNGLSRLHCRFYSENGSAMVQDLGSSNGTTLNGIDIGTNPTPITNGDCVSVGETALRISGFVASSAEPRPAVTEKVTPVSPSAFPTNIAAAPIISINPDAPVIPVTPPPPPPPPPPQPAPEVPLTAPDLFGAEDDLDVTIRTKPEPAPVGTVDLGLEAVPGGEKKRSPLLGLIFALGAILVLLGGALAIFSFENQDEKPAALRKLPTAESQAFEFCYERLVITEQSLYRYTLNYEASGLLVLAIDDLGDADRSFKKEKQLTPHAQKMLRKEVVDSNYMAIRELYPERSPDGTSLRRKTLTLVLGSNIWKRVAENVANREFDALCERLELFGRNELGVWATQYSVSELRDLGKEQLVVANRYWEQRDMGDEKLFHAVTAYKQGLSALETLNPKPEFVHELTAGLREATELLDTRYEAAAFAVDQAMNTQRYERAAEELQRILRMIPDRDDERNLKATEQLLMIENRYLRKGGR